jgi:glycosyltransferase involved in cell wall biosynthesis
MRILFTTQILHAGIGIVRAKWPCRWVNKFTDHKAECMDESDLLFSDMPGLISPFDVIVIHKASFNLFRVAEEAHKQGKIVVYDTDDNDDELYAKHYLRHWVTDSKRWRDKVIEHCSGITCTSVPLMRALHHYGKPSAVIDNGYDLTLDEYQVQHIPYFTGLDGEWLKICFGGSTGHDRDVSEWLRLGIIEALSEFKIDWYFYGVLEGGPQLKNVGNSQVRFLPGEDISSYMQSFYTNADIAIAPLLQDTFNACRSTIKLQEAGIAGIPIVVSDVESYRGFSDGVTLVDNTKEKWVDALRTLIIDGDVRKLHGQQNRNAAYARHSAEYLTKQRIEFYENL